MNLVDIAKQYFHLEHKGSNVYQIVNPSGQFDSVVIWGDTNSYHRFSNGTTGGTYEFLRYIVGLPEEEIDHDLIKDIPLLSVLSRQKTQKADTGYALQDIIGEIGYNDYIHSRMITEETASYFHLEIKDENVVIPLYDESKNRVGSLVRNCHTEWKGDRYRTILAGYNEKPFVWSFLELYKAKPNSVVILVEGAWSVMRIHQVIKPVFPNVLPLATLGTKLENALRDMLFDLPIIAILDSDNGGRKVEKQLNQWQEQGMRIEIYEPTFKSVLSMVESSYYIDDLNDKQLLKLFKFIAKHRNMLS